MTWLDYIKTRYRIAELADTQLELEAWLNSSAAEKMLAAQRSCCEQALSELSGYRLGYLGVSPGHDLLDCFDMRHRFKLVAGAFADHHSVADKVPSPVIKSAEPGGIANFDALPLPSDTIDVMILHHVLDFSPRPHEVLNEAARVVTAGGYLVVIGFNPYSALGLAKWPGALLGPSPVWRRHSLRMSRIVDWLTLLGFEVTHQHRGYCDSRGGGSLIRKSRAILDPYCGAFYVLAASKRVLPLTPAAYPRWLPVRLPALVGGRPRTSPFDREQTNIRVEKAKDQLGHLVVPEKNA